MNALCQCIFVSADASTLLTDLHAAVQGVGPGTSLGDKVAAAQTSLASSDAAAVCTTMNAFINEVQALTGRKIPAAQAEELIADAERIQAVMALLKPRRSPLSCHAYTPVHPLPQ